MESDGLYIIEVHSPVGTFTLVDMPKEDAEQLLDFIYDSQGVNQVRFHTTDGQFVMGVEAIKNSVFQMRQVV